MPGSYHQGGESQILVGTSSPPATKIGGVKTANYAKTRATNTDDFYNQEDSDVSVGKLNTRWTVTGIASTGDTNGLVLINTYIDDDTGPILYLAGSLEGTNGEIVGGRVSNLETQWQDPNRKTAYSFQVEGSIAPVDFGAGGIFEAVA